MQTIRIFEGKEKQILRHHPWVFSKAFDPTDIKAGVVRVETYDGRFIAWGVYDPKSHIPLHLLSWKEMETIDDAWWQKQIKASILRRKQFLTGTDRPTTTMRLVFGEADMLPGLVADAYGSVIRLIISSHVAWERKDLAVTTFDSLLHPSLIVVTTDPNYNSVEGMPKSALYWKNGSYFQPEEKLQPVRFREDGLFYEVVPGMGQKSGFYCDQRDNRKAIEPYVRNAVMLDAFCYTGAFTLHALRAGVSHVDMLDASEDALHQALVHIHINQDQGTIPQGSRDKVTTKACDVFEQMRKLPQAYYDVMVLDPPKLAKTKSQAENALKAYKDLNRMAMLKIKNNGIIATFSCSGAIDRETFRMMLAWAAQDAGVELQILSTLGPGPDHPIRISFPESEYLKGYIVRVLK